MRGWISQLNPKTFRSSGGPIMTEEELHREARRALAEKGIQVVGRM